MPADATPEDTAALLAELVELRARLHLGRVTDEVLEAAQRTRATLDDSLARALPLLVEHTGASAAWVRTLDETLRQRDYLWPAGEAARFGSLDALEAEAGAGGAGGAAPGGGMIVVRVIDVAGEPFGTAGVVVPEGSAAERARIDGLVHTWCEELDDYLVAIARARHKHRVTMLIGRALKHPVLDEGIAVAIDALATEVPFDDLVLVYGEEDAPAAALHHRIVLDGDLRWCAPGEGAPPADAAVLDGLRRLMRGDGAVLAELGLRDYREEVMVSGRRDEQVVGRLVVGRAGGRFNTFERDLLERVADYLRHRIVDFNREWRTLARTFSHPVVGRLLADEDYRERYLSPRERDVSILYCDISGFTRLSEQVLREPSLIGSFVDRWSAGVVSLLWETGGVFDKMIGDCIIGLWGPPFHDIDPRECCRRALEAAERIRDFTRELAASIDALRDRGETVGVATGLNHCPLFVGLFGPNENYTGFSSGMNNTARLQGLAARDEILALSHFVEVLGEPERFGGARAARVKNVAEPLVYHALEPEGRR